MIRWREIALGSKCDVFSGFPFKSDGFSSDDQDIALVKGENIGQGEILWGISKRWPRDDLPDLERYRLLPGDVVLAMDRPWVPAGLKFARVREADPEALLVQRVARLRARQGLDQGFLGQVVAAPQFVEYIKNIARGVGVPHISGQQIADFRLHLPPLDEQRRIASTLAAYDDLIENNRRRMALLEDAARQLYREWFLRLRFPGHEHTRITNGIPEGWVRKSLGDLADFRLGKMLDQNKNKGDLMPYLANINVRWGEIELRDLREMRFEEDELDVFGLRYGDIVMCEGGEPGRCAIWKEQLPRMMIQKAVHRIRARPDVSYLYLYFSLRNMGQSGQLATLFTGATIKHLPREKLALVKVDVPPARLMAHFVEQVDPLEMQIALLEAANRRASQARDLLLPRLMRGEIAA